MRTAHTAGADQRTRARLLEAGSRLFAESGFKRVTVRAICRAAHANVAAVNYHFRNKLGLYREVTEAGIAVMQKTTELAIQAGKNGTPEQKLRAYIDVLTHRLHAPAGYEWLQQLITREILDPTPALAAIVDRGLRPRLEYLSAIVGEMLQFPAGDPRVEACVTSVHAQILMFRPNPVAERLRIRGKAAPATPERVADHISTFSLAWICALAEP